MAAIDRLAHLEPLLRRLPPVQRAALLNAITQLFLEGAGRFRASQSVIFGRLFNILIDESDAETAAGVARRLAPIAHAPNETIERLARSDNIAIAEPILLRSPQIAEDVLADIARNKGQTHLLAIAVRPQVDADIVDVLIARGDDIAVRYVANNQGAQISEAGAIALAERATKDEALAALISKRSDIQTQVAAASAQARP